MKKIIVLSAFLFALGSFANAQHVSVRLSFPVGVAVGAPGPAPFAGAIWIGPQWRWDRRRYVTVPGYWERPRYHRVWTDGYWRYSRRGYVWVPGYWR